MENKNNIFLGKIEKSGCYINNGKYGYFLTCGKKNYKIPEWLEPEEVTIDMAQRLIAYKQKISEEWLEKRTDIKNESDTEVSEDTIKIKNKNNLNFSNNMAEKLPCNFEATKKYFKKNIFFSAILCLVKYNINY